ncbi:MAG: hypothetical protein K6F66_09395 [Pseudobutyrivibrio sp.]|nr:hypothetical protein [Pseudobutyrivibrio sp.]
MKIDSSHVNMASTHNSYSHTYTAMARIDRPTDNGHTYGIIVSLSKHNESSYMEAISQYNEELEDEKKEQQKENLLNSLQQMAESQKAANKGTWDLPEDFQISLLKRMLAILNGEDSKIHGTLYKNLSTIDFGNHLEPCLNTGEPVPTSSSNRAPVITASDLSVSAGRSGSMQVWERITAVEGNHSEYENTSFLSQGTVHTSDGRNLTFNVEVTLGRSLNEKINSLTSETYTRYITDPLVINLDTTATHISDQKFTFDLNVDGKDDEISYLGKGSGFLALDKNNDGIINDGSELFGTASGDGFKDLTEYDEDKNGWIDENDSVFNALKVWVKNDDGTDKLLSLKEADVGAICLRNADTEFSFKNNSSDVDGILRKTGIYLKESTGQASTIAHVDFTL